jgi:pyridinium-3,5-bisthiocarboxylic acid mononucleotide nickel chelatase
MSDRPASDTLVGAAPPGARPSGEPASGATADPRGQHLHLDCPSGAAGDMLLGALIDLGVPVEIIGDALDAIGAGRARLGVHRVVKGGIAAVDVKVDTHGHILDGHTHAPAPPPAPAPAPAGLKKRAASEPSASSGSFVAIKFRAETHERHVHVDEIGDKIEEVYEHGHVHGHAHAAQGDHGHYHYADIRKRIVGAPLAEGARTRALEIFDRLARAEAKLHGTTVDDVTFHEVGAIDSIVDVVGTAAALAWLRPTSVTCTSVAMGHGTVKSAHGVLPVPAPAALEVLRETGGVMVDGGVARELCTPTGAAVLAASVTSWSPAPAGRALCVGWGAGDMDLVDRPNVLRAVVVAPTKPQPRALADAVPAPLVTSPSGAAVSRGDSVWQVDANLDDMSPELCAPASDALFASGALDVWWTPITMKKGRPALTLSTLVEAEHRDEVIATILRETTTIGVRYAELHRTVLTRKLVEVETRYGRIPIKVAYDGDTVRNAAPEYEACAKAARVHGVPVKLVFAAALTAYTAR